MVTFLKAERKL